ncbi:MAG: TRAP transporter substrate-binding protein [Bacteriovoracia bacterium]
MRWIKSYLLPVALLFSLTAETGHCSAHSISWIFAHGPLDQQVLGMMKKYARLISEKSDSTLKVDLKYFPETQWESGRGWAYRWSDAFKKISSGEIDIGQIATDTLGTSTPALDVMDLPFLFRDHDHVEKVLTGEIGKGLLAQIAASSGGRLHAFAFTYSGGFRVVASTKKILTAEDFKARSTLDGTSYPRAAEYSYRMETLKAFGAKVVELKEAIATLGTPETKKGLFSKGPIDTFIGPYKELLYEMKVPGVPKPKFITDDNLNLFTTVIVMREDSFQKLSPEQQKVLTAEIEKMAKEERVLFIRQAQEAKKQLIKKGLVITSFNASEREKLEKLAAPVYAKFKEIPGGAELIEKIKSVH